MAETYVMALDEGTSSARAILFDHAGQVISIASGEFRQIYPRPGWVEHDATRDLDRAAGRGARGHEDSQCFRQQVAAIGITNQRETSVVWDRKTGVPQHTMPLCGRTGGPLPCAMG